MISLKELQYVSSWANRIPMPGIEYSIEILDEIEKCYNLYKEKYLEKNYSIIFSNSEEIDFEILSKNMCHMMGIDYNNIKGEYFDNYRQDAFGTSATDISSFQLLELILENKQRVAELDNDSSNSAKAINYYKSAIKCAIFNKFSDFEKFNFAAINCSVDEDAKYEGRKFLFIPSNEGTVPYFMMNIIKDNGKYVVSSLMAPDNPREIFDNQEVVIPTQILITNNDILRKVSASPEEKIQLITMYTNIINRYGLQNRLNIFGDYETTLNELANTKLLKRTK